MASIQCVVSYAGKRVVKTLYIQFDQNDRYDVLGGEPGIALLSENDTAASLAKSLKGGAKPFSPPPAKAGSKKTKQSATKPPAVVVALRTQKPSQAAVAPQTKLLRCAIAVPADKVAKFACGYVGKKGFDLYLRGQDLPKFP